MVDWVLLVLRIVTAGVLLGFMGAVFVVLWRDYRAVSGPVAERFRGRLVVIRADQHDGLELPSSDADVFEGAETVVGGSYPLLPITTLGRAPTNTVVLEEPFCSQEHALVAHRGGQWWLEDRGSSNGTLLNGELVTEPVVVSSGDVIGIGRIVLKVELE